MSSEVISESAGSGRRIGVPELEMIFGGRSRSPRVGGRADRSWPKKPCHGGVTFVTHDRPELVETAEKGNEERQNDKRKGHDRNASEIRMNNTG